MIKNTCHFEYGYTVMPFSLKNAGATYQHAMSITFRDHLRKMVECCVDDITVKSHRKHNHLHENGVQHHAGSSAENKPDKVILGSIKRQIPWIHCHIQKNSS